MSPREAALLAQTKEALRQLELGFQSDLPALDVCVDNLLRCVQELVLLIDDTRSIAAPMQSPRRGRGRQKNA